MYKTEVVNYIFYKWLNENEIPQEYEDDDDYGDDDKKRI